MLNDGWIKVFRAGDYGTKGKYTSADLDTMVANYDPAKHEAPLTLGEPKLDAPAYGWVESLKRVGDVLMAKLRQVPSKVQTMIETGAFNKLSASFYRNPLSLRHIGFLGAVPSQIEGLAGVRFSEQQFETIEFSEGARARGLVRFTETDNRFSVLCNVQLAEDAAALSLADKISYSEALARLRRCEPLKFTEAPGVPADAQSVELAEAAQKLSAEKGISYGDALMRVRREKAGSLRFNECPGVYADPESIELAEAAEQLATKENISYGEALMRARAAARG